MDHFCYLRFIFVCYAVVSFPCSFEIICWERADVLTVLCVMLSSVFVTFPCAVRPGCGLVKPVLNGDLKIDKTKILMTNGS